MDAPVPSSRSRAVERVLLVLAFVLVSAGGCTRVPVAELSAYREQFALAKTSAEDYVLSTKTAATELADDPGAPGSIAERNEKLRRRLDALDERLKALRILSQYNDALAKLAEGEDPEKIGASLKNFSETLASFDVAKLSSLVGDVAPYGQVISGAVAIIDRLVRQERFRDAVGAGEKPVVAIVELLVKDADDVYTINEQRILLRADPKRMAVQDLGDRFREHADRFAFPQALSPRFDELLERQNQLRASFKGRARPLPALAHSAPATSAGDEGAALATLALLNEQTAALLTEYNDLIAQAEAEKKLIEEYKNVLRSTQLAFVQVRAGLDTGRGAVVIGFIADAYRLRQAYLAAREAKGK